MPLEDRIRVLLESGRLGLLLVFLVLALFLKFRLALWVSVGIAVSFMGALGVLPLVDVSINVMSLFAFLLVLGIVVDDAIVVGENIYRHFEMGKTGRRAAIDGARQVATPVVFSILTTLAAFSPLINSVGGPSGAIARTIPLVVIGCLGFSLIESMLVLPNHLSHLSHRREDRERHGLSRRWYRFQGFFSERMKRVVDRWYRPLIERAIEWRYSTLAIAVAVLFIVAGYVLSGRVKFEFFEDVEGDNAVVLLTMPRGTPADVTLAAVRRIEAAAFEVQAELRAEGHGDAFRHVMATVGSQPYAVLQRANGPTVGVDVAVASPHEGEVNVELVSALDRTIRTAEVVRRWREKVGRIPDAVRVEYTSSLVGFGAPVGVQLTGRSLDEFAVRGSGGQGASGGVSGRVRHLGLVSRRQAGDAAGARPPGRGAGPEPRRPGTSGEAGLLRRRSAAGFSAAGTSCGSWSAIRSRNARRWRRSRTCGFGRRRGRRCPSLLLAGPSSAAASRRSSGSTGGGRWTSPRTWIPWW